MLHSKRHGNLPLTWFIRGVFLHHSVDFFDSADQRLLTLFVMRLCLILSFSCSPFHFRFLSASSKRVGCILIFSVELAWLSPSPSRPHRHKLTEKLIRSSSKYIHLLLLSSSSSSSFSRSLTHSLSHTGAVPHSPHSISPDLPACCYATRFPFLFPFPFHWLWVYRLSTPSKRRERSGQYWQVWLKSLIIWPFGDWRVGFQESGGYER